MRLPVTLLAILPLSVPVLEPDATAQVPATAAEIKACLDRGRPALRKHLQRARGDVLALVCLAALHDQIQHTDKVLARALRRLDAAVLKGTYGAALRLMVMAEAPLAFGGMNLLAREKRIARDVTRLLKNRFRGGFTYAKRNPYWDLSNTQYAALGLRAAVSLGHVVPERIWLEMLKTILSVQFEDGGFGYTKTYRRKKAYSSMTVAGIAVLQICRQNLPADVCKELKVDDALKLAWRWMETNKGDIGISVTLSCLYFHYGLERAAVLSDVERVGGRDWYRVGAGMILDMQDKKRGSWRSSWEIRPGALPGPGSQVDTAFAVLFLRRHFKKHLPARYPRMAVLNAQSTDPEIEAAARHAVRLGDKSMPGVLKGLRSELSPRRRAAALALRELAGEDFGYDPKLEPAKTGAAIKAAEKWWLNRKDK